MDSDRRGRSRPCYHSAKVQRAVGASGKLPCQSAEAHGLCQHKDESLDDFVNHAKLQAQKCNFSADEISERLLELIIDGTPDPDFQNSLLRKEKTFILEDALKLGRTYRSSCQRLKGHADLSVDRDHQVSGLQQLWNKTCSEEMPSIWKQLQSLWKGQPSGQSMPFIR